MPAVTYPAPPLIPCSMFFSLMQYLDALSCEAQRCSGPPPCKWIIGSSPIFRGQATAAVKRIALKVIAKVKKWLHHTKGWPPSCGTRSISKGPKKCEWSTIPRHATRARCNWKNRGSDLAASMCGVGHTSFTCWDRECHATGLRSPVSLGPSIISQGLYQEMFRDLLIWGEAICKSRVEEGGGTRVADFIQPTQPLRMRPFEKI